MYFPPKYFIEPDEPGKRASYQSIFTDKQWRPKFNNAWKPPKLQRRISFAEWVETTANVSTTAS